MQPSVTLVVVVISVLCELVISAPDVKFSFGTVKGRDGLSQTTNVPYYAYYGIPFAEPPVGDLRLRRPQPFQGKDPNVVISSENFRSACLQPIFAEGYVMEEDCLYLNVYKPQAGAQPKKVMVWIYGGGFFVGDTYGYVPSRMVTSYDVIVVTFNYRLNVFGFLSSGNGDGNYGLYDQVMALQWVKDNIAQFGGDPNDVAIFGESAGSASVNFLSLSPLTKGLFTKAIMQSGAATSPWAFKESRAAMTQFDQLIQATDCKPWLYFSSIRHIFYDRIMDCLRRKTSEELGLAGLGLYSDSLSPPGDPKLHPSGKLSQKLFLPVVDENLVPKSPKLMTSDKEYMRTNGVLDRKYVIGFNNAEGLGDLESFLQNPGEDPTSITLGENAEQFVKAAADGYFKYFGTPNSVAPVLQYEYTYPRYQGRVNLMKTLNAATDVDYVIPTMELVSDMLAASPDTEIYLYLFDHYPQQVNPSDGIYGTSHAMEILYEFDFTAGLAEMYSYYAKIPADDGSDLPLFDVFPGFLTQFAKSGDPSRGVTNWPRYDLIGQSYMAIAPQPEVRQKVFDKRVQLWTKVIPEIRRRGGPFKQVRRFFKQLG